MKIVHCGSRILFRIITICLEKISHVSSFPRATNSAFPAADGFCSLLHFFLRFSDAQDQIYFVLVGHLSSLDESF